MTRPLLAAAAVLALLAVACSGDGDNSTDPTPDLTPTAAAGADCSPARARAAGDTAETVMSGGVARKYILHVPAGYAGESTVPLVLVFHGLALTAQFTSDMTALGDDLDERGWIGVFPDGTETPQRWNAYGLANGADDSQFVTDMLAQLESTLCVDAGSVFAAGYSNGGGMAMRFACDNPDRLAAIAPVAATYIPCQENVPMIAFHGSKDPVVPYEGGPSPLPDIQFPAVHRAASEWARALGCDGLPTLSRTTPNVELSTYGRCTNGDGEALLYTVLNGGHTWPDAAIDLPENIAGVTSHEISANDLMLDFFEAHRR